jgi:hypothetical protein
MSDNKYRVEYAASGRSKCRNPTCKEQIVKGALRIGKVTKNPFDENGDSTLTQWYHAACFFEAQKRSGTALWPFGFDLCTCRMRATTKKVQAEGDLEAFETLDADGRQQVLSLIAGTGIITSNCSIQMKYTLSADGTKEQDGDDAPVVTTRGGSRSIRRVFKCSQSHKTKTKPKVRAKARTQVKKKTKSKVDTEEGVEEAWRKTNRIDLWLRKCKL